jgi:hypothetical protein
LVLIFWLRDNCILICIPAAVTKQKCFLKVGLIKMNDLKNQRKIPHSGEFAKRFYLIA